MILLFVRKPTFLTQVVKKCLDIAVDRRGEVVEKLIRLLSFLNLRNDYKIDSQLYLIPSVL